MVAGERIVRHMHRGMLTDPNKTSPSKRPKTLSPHLSFVEAPPRAFSSTVPTFPRTVKNGPPFSPTSWVRPIVTTNASLMAWVAVSHHSPKLWLLVALRTSQRPSSKSPQQRLRVPLTSSIPSSKSASRTPRSSSRATAVTFLP